MLLEKQSFLQMGSQPTRITDAKLVRLADLSLYLALEDALFVLLVQNFLQESSLIIIKVLNLIPQAELFALFNFINEFVFTKFREEMLIGIIKLLTIVDQLTDFCPALH